MHEGEEDGSQLAYWGFSATHQKVETRTLKGVVHHHQLTLVGEPHEGQGDEQDPLGAWDHQMEGTADDVQGEQEVLAPWIGGEHLVEDHRMGAGSLLFPSVASESAIYPLLRLQMCC